MLETLDCQFRSYLGKEPSWRNCKLTKVRAHAGKHRVKQISVYTPVNVAPSCDITYDDECQASVSFHNVSDMFQFLRRWQNALLAQIWINGVSKGGLHPGMPELDEFSRGLLALDSTI